ncbi:MAG: ATP-dependent RNA helicase HrpA [Gammaproteobacteria bacterium]|nr:ATP-dependent RNA helicase HrpA [Gammaproteobacteria bacterium]
MWFLLIKCIFIVFSEIKDCLSQCMLVDRKVFARRLHGLSKRIRSGKPCDKGLQALSKAVQASIARAQQRRQSLPVPQYPVELPVVQQKEAIMTAIAGHQVVIISGATGSGKTTQIPKILLEMGRGVLGVIGHTQPRRIAARSLAKRIADELGVDLGGKVGCKVRFSDQTSEQGYIKVMTDGMLLAETQSDPDLLAYDTLIIDEAHERSLNIDFMLGYLKQLLMKRPQLKLIITSATIDPERFSRHFNDAPLVEISGRSYPVEIRYHSMEQGQQESSAEQRQLLAISQAVTELARVGSGDILVFLSGEREIRETAEYLRKHQPARTEILPLYGRLSFAEQNRVFSSHQGRRVVLATNVAETSLTVPGIHYVIDAGKVRMSRYSYRTRVQRLPIEAISQASANQRSGRCGRTAAGVCIRLYAEEDFEQRPLFTEPEILRTNLAAVILQMLSLQLGDIDQFPFLEKPDSRLVSDGYKLLRELGAVDEHKVITSLGRQLARLPVDPGIARMMLSASSEACLSEVLIIATGLTLQDPRERPLDHAQRADECHAVFADESSDFISYLKLWYAWREQKRHLSSNQLRKWCRENFLSPLRMREWMDIQRQLHAMATEMGLHFNKQEANYDAIHRALLSGLLGNISCNTEAREYTGARNIKLHIFPGSGLFKKKHKWIMAAEMVETGRRYARTVAKIDPYWIESLAPQLLKRHYFEPHWEKRVARVAAFERVSLYGLVLVEKRRVNFSAIDAVQSREIFIRSALVNGDYRTRAEFFHHNRRCIEAVELLEAKARRRDVLVDEEQLYAFYDERIPVGICSGVDFDSWRKKIEKDQPRLLYLSRDALMQHDAAQITEQRFPDVIEVSGISLTLEYSFNPGQDVDGVIVNIPLPILAQLPVSAFSWLVPGLLQDKVVALIKSLPKALRRYLVPAPDYAESFLRATEGDGDLLRVMSDYFSRIGGIQIASGDWRPELLDKHFFMTFRIIDGSKVLGQGSDLLTLQKQYKGQVEQVFSGSALFEDLERSHIERWDFPDLPECIERQVDGVNLRAYPALMLDGKGVALRVFDSIATAHENQRQGLMALYKKECVRDLRAVEKGLSGIQQLCLYYSGIGQCKDLRQDIMDLIVQQTFLAEGTDIRSKAVFDQYRQAGIPLLGDVSNSLCTWLGEALREYHAIAKRLKGNITVTTLAAINEIKSQLGYLIYPGFVQKASWQRIRHLARYLRALSMRMDKLEVDASRDRQLAQPISVLWTRYQERKESLSATDPLLEEYRWLLEEYRVSVFAQTLKTAVPVSAKRLDKLWAQIIK